MSNPVREVFNTPFSFFTEPLQEALLDYSQRANGSVQFHLAGELAHVEGKPNTARAAISVSMGDIAIGTALAVLFKPGDGTGDTGTLQLEEVETDPWPPEARVIPRQKPPAVTAYETWTSLLTYDPETETTALNLGSLDMLGIEPNLRPNGPPHSLVRLGTYGVSAARLDEIMNQPNPVGTPETIYTTGYFGHTLGRPHEGFSRFGDPHAFYYPHAFTAVTYKSLSGASSTTEPTGAQYDSTAKAAYINGDPFTSFSSVQAIYDKVAYINANGIGGIILWEIGQAYFSATEPHFPHMEAFAGEIIQPGTLTGVQSISGVGTITL